jgi:hypothetical protein
MNGDRHRNVRWHGGTDLATDAPMKTLNRGLRPQARRYHIDSRTAVRHTEILLRLVVSIICDTDAGSDVDDYLALAYLVRAARAR